MNSASAHTPTLPRWVTTIFGPLSLLGFVGLMLTFFLSFETPNRVLFAMSAALTFAAPLVVLGHFVATRTLTAAEKRIWIQDLTSAEVWSAMSEYVASPDLRASARRRAEDAAARRAMKNQG